MATDITLLAVVASHALFIFQVTLGSILQLLLLWAWAMRPKILHLLLWAMLPLLGIPLLHSNSILLALFLGVHTHCLWLYLCWFVVCNGLRFDIFCVVLPLMGVVGSTTALFLDLLTLGVRTCLYWSFLFSHHQIFGLYLVWMVLPNLLLQICGYRTLNCCET